MFPLNRLQLVHHIDWIRRKGWKRKKKEKAQTVTLILHIIIESHMLDILFSLIFLRLHVNMHISTHADICRLLSGSSCNSLIDVFL